jgi:hypothetical protein
MVRFRPVSGCVKGAWNDGGRMLAIVASAEQVDIESKDLTVDAEDEEEVLRRLRDDDCW